MSSTTFSPTRSHFLPVADPGSRAYAGDGLHPLVLALLELNASHTRQLLASFLAQWPAAVAALQAESRNQDDVSAALALKATVANAGLNARFEQELLLRLNPLRRLPRLRLFDFDRLSQTPEEESEEAAALAALTGSFERAAGRPGLQAQMALAQAARRLGTPALAEALGSAAPAAAWLATLRALGVSPQARMLALRPFENTALPLWSQWLAAAAALVAEPAMAVQDASSAAEAVTLSAPARASLRSIANSAEAGVDARLAEELLHADRERADALPALIAFNDWFDTLKAEPQLPTGFHADWEGLRFGLCKAALLDPAFFTAVSHPVRSAASAVCLRAALSQAGLVAGAQVRNAMRRLLSEFAPATLDLIARLPTLAALPASGREAFAAHCERESRERLDALLDTVRHAALERAGERKLPPSALPVFRAGLVPLLAAAWLRDGSGSAAERTALALLSQWQQSRSAQQGALIRSAVKSRLQTAWAGLGADALRIEGLGRQLEATWQDASASAAHPASDTESEINALLNALEEPLARSQPAPVTPAASAQAARANALAALLSKGRWLRIASGEHGAARFLSISLFDAAASTVTLSTATGEIAQCLPAASLLADLHSGKAQLLSPTAETQQHLEALKAP